MQEAMMIYCEGEKRQEAHAMRTRIHPLLLAITLIGFGGAAMAAKLSDRSDETAPRYEPMDDGETAPAGRSSVVSTTPLPDAGPMTVTPTRNEALEREHCMRLFEDPEFVRSCVKNSDGAR